MACRGPLRLLLAVALGTLGTFVTGVDARRQLRQAPAPAPATELEKFLEGAKETVSGVVEDVGNAGKDVIDAIGRRLLAEEEMPPFDTPVEMLKADAPAPAPAPAPMMMMMEDDETMPEARRLLAATSEMPYDMADAPAPAPAPMMTDEEMTLTEMVMIPDARRLAEAPAPAPAPAPAEMPEMPLVDVLHQQTDLLLTQELP